MLAKLNQMIAKTIASLSQTANDGFKFAMPLLK